MAKKEKMEPTATVDKEWEAKCDYDTLVKSEEIKADKKRFQLAMGVAKKTKKQIKTLDDLYAAQKDMMSVDEDDSEEA